MKSLVSGLFAGAALLTVNTACIAAIMDISASFSPSMDKPENNQFTNTTPQSGYCVSLPNQCTNGSFSISMGGITASLATSGFTANSEPRMGMYFKMPAAWRDVVITNQSNGNKVALNFRVSAFAAEYSTRSSWSLSDHQQAWNGGSFVYAPSPCGYSGVGYWDAKYYRFMWKWPVKDAACSKTAKKDLTGEPYSIIDTSIGYELKTPDPLKLESGIYTGILTLTVGPGGDIDFGDNFQASDTELILKFTLSVNHELKLTTTADEQAVSLQPCASGRICTADAGSANWERWMVTRVTPELTGRSQFSLSSSGSFRVYLECEQQSGTDCALRSDKMPSQLVPIRTLLTLPDNIVDMVTGSTVSRRQLEAAGNDFTKNNFTTKSFGQNRTGSIDFLVNQKEVDTMLTTRPDTYRGAVTVIFDPKIY